MAQYQPPNWFTKNAGNTLVALLVKLGFKPQGAHLLAVRRRKSGQWRTVPVNPLPHEGARYLVVPRGETEWVRNLRAAGEGELRSGSNREPIRVTEVADGEKPPLRRDYLERWDGVTGAYFGATKDSPDDELRRIAPDHPVFRIEESAR